MITPPKILVIKSKTSELEKVECFLKETFEYYQLPGQSFNKVFLCISEAVVNSIEHGNKYNENKSVSIEITCKKNEFNVIIKDEGEGFDIYKIPNPTLEDNIRKESGRGLFIIKSYCDKMEVNKNESFIHFKMDSL